MSYLLRIMGNCLTSRKSNKTSLTGTTGNNEKLLRVVKTDGKVLEYRSSILVKDLLVNFTGFGVGISQRSSQQFLESNYELKTGQIYYLLPCFGPVLNPPSTNVPPEVSSVKRIKVVITKQQLQDLLSKNISVDAILSGLQKGATTTTWEEDDHDDSVSSSRSWKPKLETIQE